MARYIYIYDRVCYTLLVKLFLYANYSLSVKVDFSSGIYPIRSDKKSILPNHSIFSAKATMN